MIKKMQAAIRWQYGKEKILETEIGRTRSHCVENWLERDYKPVARQTT